MDGEGRDGVKVWGRTGEREGGALEAPPSHRRTNKTQPPRPNPPTKPKADVINRGFGGFFTNWLREYMLDELFDVKDPRMGVLFLGVKDSQLKQVAG